MKLITPSVRLSIGLTLLVVNLLFIANMVGLFPDETELTMAMRKDLTESLALQFSAAAEKDEFQTIQNALRALVERNEDIRSAAIRENDGKLVALAGEHLAFWDIPESDKSTTTHVIVPVFRKGEKWANVEVRFGPLWVNSLTGGFGNSFNGLLIFLVASLFPCTFWVIRKSLRQLDPMAVIPERIQKAFDVLQEGVLILDKKEQIVLANNSLAKLLGRSPEEIIGRKGSELGWLNCKNPKDIKKLPWVQLLQQDIDRKGASLTLLNHLGHQIKLAVNAANIIDNTGKIRGILVTFDDITQLEEKNFELGTLVEKLEQSQEEIQEQNRKLEFLANRDPLTRCLNRRALGRMFETLFSRAKNENKHLSCLMVDIDFFKKVNDNYGHATGDEVIKGVANILQSNTRDTDLVGRYGGEEFCVVLTDLHMDKATQIAERIRHTIEENSLAGINVTASLGVSSLDTNINNPEDLVGLADKALYAAKNSGRNRVITWGEEVQALTDVTENEEKSKAEDGKNDKQTMKLRKRVSELEGLLEKRNQEIEHYKIYDAKTGLPTLSHFEDRISQEIARSKRNDYFVTVLSMSIDTINRVHSTLGQEAADQLVVACSNRLNSSLRGDFDIIAMVQNKKDLSSISLVNHAEFGIMLTEIKQADHVTWIIKRILDSFAQPFRVKDQEIYAIPFIGVSIYPNDGKSADELYSNAINACNHAKNRNSKERYLCFSQSLNDMAVRQLKVESSLHDAISQEELQLHFQPKVEAVSQQTIGFEALLRWNSAKLGFVPPGDFINVAEQTGQIHELGNWVLYNACKQLKEWMDMGLSVKPIAVNVSEVQLREQDLAQIIQDLLDEFDLVPAMLEIELTESSLVNPHDISLATLRKMKEIGVKVAVDDFGTGYSSLSYLRKIPLSCLKIDRSFINDINSDDSANSLISSIISMAHGLNLEVVAEGVETESQINFLRERGCQYLQGYYFSRPLPPEEVAEILAQEDIAIAG